jgi:hypothetical protein
VTNILQKLYLENICEFQVSENKEYCSVFTRHYKDNESISLSKFDLLLLANELLDMAATMTKSEEHSVNKINPSLDMALRHLYECLHRAADGNKSGVDTHFEIFADSFKHYCMSKTL